METFRGKIERLIRQMLGPLVKQLLQYQISPNAISITGFLVTLVAVGLFVGGQPLVAGIIFLAGSLFDVLDGELARAGNRATPFGAAFDSLLDRVSEGTLLIAIAWFFASQGEIIGVVATTAAMLGAVLTSYVRSRAEALGTSCTVGWITRPERVLILVVGLIVNILLVAVVALSLLTVLTVIQRVVHIHRMLRDDQPHSLNEIDPKQ